MIRIMDGAQYDLTPVKGRKIALCELLTSRKKYFITNTTSMTTTLLKPEDQWSTLVK